MADDIETTPEGETPEGVSTPETETDQDADIEGQDLDADAAGEGDEHPEGDDGEFEEVEFEGKSYRLPPELKSALLRQADYTRKTQEVSETRKALEGATEAAKAAAAAADKQVAAAQAITEDRVQYGWIEKQLKALDETDWEKLEEDDPATASRLTRDLSRLRNRQIELATKITRAQQELDQDRQRSAKQAHDRAVTETQATLKRDIKGWNDDLALKVGEFAIGKLGYTAREVVGITDARQVKAIHAAYLHDQALRRAAQQRKLQAGDQTAPVRRPGGGGASPNARRTTDASGDGLTTVEWIKRERERNKAAKK